MLKFGAVHFNDRARIPKQYLRCRFNDSGFSGTRRTKKQEVTDRSPRRVQARAKHLVHIDQRLPAFGLPNNLGTQRAFDVASMHVLSGRIKLVSNCSCHFPQSFFAPATVWKTIEVSLPCFFEIEHGECQPPRAVLWPKGLAISITYVCGP